MKRVLEYAFTSSLLAGIAWGLWSGRGWNATTALFPRAVGVPMLGVLAGILAMEIARGRRRESAGDGDPAFRERAGRMARYFGWLLGFVAAIWAVGMSWSIPIYILAYMRVEGRYGWGRCVVHAAVTAGLIAIVFGQAFRVAWPEGVLLRVLGL